jgi:hypothetical protein
MNATVFEGGKVHLLTDQAARCGVGKQPKRGQWQTDLGEVTCLRCVKLRPVDERRLAAGEAANGRVMGTEAGAGGTHCPTHRLEAGATTEAAP